MYLNKTPKLVLSIKTLLKLAHQNSPSAMFLTAKRSLSIGGTSSHSRPPLAQAPTYSLPGPRGFLNFTN